MKITIYGIRFEGKIVYVGQTKFSYLRRFLEHKTKAKGNKNHCPKLYNHMRCHGLDNYKAIEIEKCSEEESESREKHWISFYDTFRNGCNLHPGGNQTRGEHHYMYKQQPAKHIVAASVAARIGKPLSEEHKAKQRESAEKVRYKRRDLKPIVCDQTGKTWDSVASCARYFDVNTAAVRYRILHEVERKARDNNALGEFTFSYVGVAHVRIVQKNAKNSFKIRCNETGQLFKNMRQACNVLDLSTSQLCKYFKDTPLINRGVVRHVKGYTFTKEPL